MELHSLSVAAVDLSLMADLHGVSAIMYNILNLYERTVAKSYSKVF